MIKAIIFDWNGVISDSLKLDHQLFLEDVKNLGLKVPRSLRYYKGLFNSNVYENLIKIGFSKEMLAEDKKYKEGFLKNLEKAKIFPSTKKLLQILHKKYKIALITSNYDITVNAFNKKYKENPPHKCGGIAMQYHIYNLWILLYRNTTNTWRIEDSPVQVKLCFTM